MIKLRNGNARPVAVGLHNDCIELNFHKCGYFSSVFGVELVTFWSQKENHGDIMCQSKRIVSNFKMYILFVTRLLMNAFEAALDLIKPMVGGKFLDMATCGYSSYVGGPCGSSIQNHTNVQ